ncbi:hypothetical protein [Lichenifustis flavocetrariae]|uniref:Uncharacterized protein n=1 Tax=Lichenifustis flavocetrariae TaxID=2949735 RepID=A0AA41Z391_9HYPH|nr:hypothetical protein [Lichenifustis flavocetrariae]MCW6512073.1 hypothetical protein [Lichenifustis flavocetrariae]
MGLSSSDAARVQATLDMMQGNGLRDFAITGGVAVAAHLASISHMPRPLNDLDLIVAGAGALPSCLAAGLLVSHVHLDAKPGRMLLQLVEPETRLRVDIFGAIGGQLRRSRPLESLRDGLYVVSPADLVARLKGLLLDLGLDEVVPAKHARDHAALLAHGAVDGIEVAWAEHRRARHPAAFGEACRQAQALTREKAHFLAASGFKPCVPCERCREAQGFRVAAGERIVAP